MEKITIKHQSGFTLIDLLFVIAVSMFVIGVLGWFATSLGSDEMGSKKQNIIEEVSNNAHRTLVEINTAAAILALQRQMAEGYKLSLEEVLQSGMVSEHPIQDGKIIFPVVFSGKTLLSYEITTAGTVPNIGAPYAKVSTIEIP